jgi:hypothetical protein
MIYHRGIPDKCERILNFIGSFKLAEVVTIKPLNGKSIEVTEGNKHILKAIMDGIKAYNREVK